MLEGIFMEQSFKWLIIVIFISILSVVSVSAEEICLNPVLPNITCIMATPTLSCVGDYYYVVYDNSSNPLEYGNLTPFTTSTYYFDFNYDVGTYYLEICDGSTRQIIVAGDTMIGLTSETWVFVLLILLFVLFVYLSFAIHPIFMFLCGIIFSYFAYYSFATTHNWFILVIMSLVAIALMFISIIAGLYKGGG